MTHLICKGCHSGTFLFQVFQDFLEPSVYNSQLTTWWFFLTWLLLTSVVSSPPALQDDMIQLSCNTSSFWKAPHSPRNYLPSCTVVSAWNFLFYPLSAWTSSPLSSSDAFSGEGLSWPNILLFSYKSMLSSLLIDFLLLSCLDSQFVLAGTIVFCLCVIVPQSATYEDCSNFLSTEWRKSKEHLAICSTNYFKILLPASILWL